MTDGSLDARLRKLTNNQLIEVIERLLNRAPELTDLVHLPVRGEAADIDTTHIANQVRDILWNMGDDWRASSRAEVALWPLLTIAEGYLDQGRRQDAQRTYTTIIGAILEQYEAIRDEESEVAGIVSQCVEGLGRCLRRCDTSAERQNVLDDIVAVYRWDTLEAGGYGMSDAPQQVVNNLASPAEKEAIARAVEAALPSTTGRFARWKRRTAGRWILALREHQALDHHALEGLYERAAMTEPLTALWLDQGRHVDALRLLANAVDDEVLPIANALAHAGFETEAVDVVKRHPVVVESSAHAVRSWLQDRGIEISEELTQLTRLLGRVNWSGAVRDYNTVRQLAERLGRWDQVKVRIELPRTQSKSKAPMRARVLALRGEADAALQELDLLKDGPWRTAAEDVADTLAADHPSAARVLYAALKADCDARGTKAAKTMARRVRGKLEALVG